MRLSGTAVQQWLDCPRAFWFQRVIGRKQPETDAMRTGTFVHSAIEKYLEYGTWPEYQPDVPDWLPVRIAQAGAEYLAPLHLEVASGAAEIEVPFEFPAGTLGPFGFTGRIDLRSWAHGPRIVDHKTTSDLKAPWHLDEDGMRSNLQLRLYAALGFPDDSNTVRIGHIYYLTKPPFGSRELHVDVDRATLVRTRDDVSRTAEAIAQVVEVKDIEAQDTIPSRRSNCTKYGGCPHKAYCNDSPANEAAKLQRLVAKVNAVTLPTIQRKGPVMPLFPKTATASAPAPAPVTIAPGQVRPPDAPVATASDAAAEKLRRLLIASLGNSGQALLGVVRASAEVIGMSTDQSTDAVAHGIAHRWWTVTNGTLHMADAVKSADPAPVAATAAPAQPAPPETPAPGTRIADPQRDALIATCEGFVGKFGEDRVKGVAENLGLKRWRKAGSENLAALAKALESMTAGPVATPAHTATTPTTYADVRVILTELRNAAASDGFDAKDYGEVGIIEVRTALAEANKVDRSTVSDDRIQACLNEGADRGFWVYGGADSMSPIWKVIIDGPIVPAVRPAPAPVEPIPPHSSDPVRLTAKARREIVPNTSGCMVFVGCAPVGIATPSLETWLWAQLDEIEATADDDFWRYNKMPSALANAVKLGLRTGLTMPPMLAIPARHPWEPYVVPVLAAFGCTVVRAFV